QAQIARQRLSKVLDSRRGGESSADILAELNVDDHVRAAERALERATPKLEQAQTKRHVLLNFTKEKTTKELKGEVEKAQSEELVKKAMWEAELAKEKKLQRQIESSRLTAPIDGLVVYANDPNRAPAGRPQIEEGATVRERQILFYVVDLNSPMQVNT